MPPDTASSTTDYMDRAIDLAMKGRGAVEPNPMVGCVLVKDGRVIGEGYHQKYGAPHAEPNALASCTESPAGSTAYVTLEPCCHTNKQTPPCVPRLIQARLNRVVIGTLDPNPQVAGRGAAELRSAGIAVEVINSPQSLQLIAPFVGRMTLHRPYVTLKWAQTADGKVTGAMGRRLQISNEHSMRVVHELRSRCDAILVGIDTVLCDDPILTVRRAEPVRPLVRIVLDRTLRMPVNSRLAKTTREGEVVVYTTRDALDSKLDCRRALEAAGIELRTVPAANAGMNLHEVIVDIGRRSITHLLVEPGPRLAASFLRGDGPWDRLWVVQSPMTINEPTALDAAAHGGVAVTHTLLGTDLLTEFFNHKSELFFHADASADMVMAGADRAAVQSNPHVSNGATRS